MVKDLEADKPIFFLNYKITLLLFTFYFIFFLMRERLVDYFFTSLSCDNR